MVEMGRIRGGRAVKVEMGEEGRKGCVNVEIRRYLLTPPLPLHRLTVQSSRRAVLISRPCSLEGWPRRPRH